MSAVDDNLLPYLKQSLLPYVKSRQEASRIRRVLTSYLASCLSGVSPNIVSALSLALPNPNINVEIIPAELSGIRKDYLVALQANVKARESYERVSRHFSLTTEPNVDVNRCNGEPDHAQSVLTYLDLLQMEKKKEKLELVQKYIKLLRKTRAAGHNSLLEEMLERSDNATNNFTFTPEGQKAHQSLGNDAQCQGLKTRLNQAVLRTNESLIREKSLLRDLLARHRDVGEAPQASKAMKMKALLRTRDELVSWIEQQLAKVNQAADDAEIQTVSQSTADSKSDSEQRGLNIKETYQDYVRIRRSIVELLSDRQRCHQARVQDREISANPEELTIEPKGESHEAQMILPRVSEYVMPITNAHKTMLQQDNHLSRSLDAQIRTMNRVLAKLADESHLLAHCHEAAAELRVPAPHNDLAAIGNSTLPGSCGMSGDALLSIMRHVAAWTSAGGEAEIEINKGLSEQLYRGEQHASAAEDSLLQIRNLVGVENEDGGGTDDDS